MHHLLELVFPLIKDLRFRILIFLRFNFYWFLFNQYMYLLQNYQKLHKILMMEMFMRDMLFEYQMKM